MRKQWQLLIVAGVLALSGCSGHNRNPLESSRGPGVETIGPTSSTEETIEGPTLRAGTDTTIPALEVPEKKPKPGPGDNPEIIIASDIHYLAKELTDFGKAFEEMTEHEDGKMVSYVWEITDAFWDEVIEQQPKALILTGDLTLEGERLSHEALAHKLELIEDEGIQVMVIPGNHDINNSKAAMYKGTDKMPAERTTPEVFAEIYDAFGYGEALSRDPASLSYVYELDDDTWLLMLDTCQYEEDALIGGMIEPETYDWIEEQLDEAWYQKKEVIAVGHHNLFDESRVYESNCTIEHSEELAKRLSDWDVKLFLSGHLHVQRYKYSETYEIDEIVTGSLVISPCMYGVLDYHGDGKFEYYTDTVDVSSWAEKKRNPDGNLQNFETYADEYLEKDFYKQAQLSLKDKELAPIDKEDMAELYALLNIYDTAGRAIEIREEVLESPAYELWQEHGQDSICGMYLNEILDDAVCDYNILSRP